MFTGWRRGALCSALGTLLGACVTAPPVEAPAPTAAAPALDAGAALSFLAVSDIHLDGATAASAYDRDTGTLLWKTALAKMRDLISRTRPRFVLVLGDLSAHDQTAAARAANIGKVLKDLRETVGSALPVFTLPGNNDSLGGNYHSFSDRSGRNAYGLDPAGSWPGLNAVDCAAAAAAAAADDRPCLLDRPADLRLGYYAAYPLGTARPLRLVALNTVILTAKYASDDGVPQRQAASQEFAWLRSELASAKARGEAVILAMHVPPGRDYYSGKPMWAPVPVEAGGRPALAAFLALADEYRGTIKLVLSSHTHFDELRLLTDAQGRVATLGVSIPSVSPVHGNNPALKSIVLADETYMPAASTTFYSTPGAPAWGESSYSFRRDYGCRDGQSMTECVAVMPVAAVASAMNGEFAVHSTAHELPWQKVDEAIFVGRAPR